MKERDDQEGALIAQIEQGIDDKLDSPEKFCTFEGVSRVMDLPDGNGELIGAIGRMVYPTKIKLELSLRHTKMIEGTNFLTRRVRTPVEFPEERALHLNANYEENNSPIEILSLVISHGSARIYSDNISDYQLASSEDLQAFSNFLAKAK